MPEPSSPNPAHCGLSVLAYHLPPRAVTVGELCRSGRTRSSEKQLINFGFRKIRLADGSASDLGEAVVGKLLRKSGRDPRDVDVIFYATALESPAAARRKRDSRPSRLFQYPACKLQVHFGMQRANVVGVSQAGCASFFSAVRMARGLITSEPGVNLALCVAAEALPPGENREVLYNLISDGACAALVERDAPVNRITAYAQTTKGFYWDSAEKEQEIVAAYFPTARAVIREALDQAGLTLDDIRLVIPHNVNRLSWRVLLSILDIPKEKFFGRNIASRGHTIAADNIMNLDDAVRLNRVRSGDYVMLFTFGFGAHWVCMILQH